MRKSVQRHSNAPRPASLVVIRRARNTRLPSLNLRSTRRDLVVGDARRCRIRERWTRSGLQAATRSTD